MGLLAIFSFRVFWETGKGALRDTLQHCARLRSLLGFQQQFCLNLRALAHLTSLLVFLIEVCHSKST